MFTGIIEATGVVQKIAANGSNKTFWIKSPISSELKKDQSVSHDGICLTVEAVDSDIHQVTAVQETLHKTTIERWGTGHIVNIERCMQMSSRFDGHIVQGHVDTVAKCLDKVELDGSWKLSFEVSPAFAKLIIEKGSICINGISLTLFDLRSNVFSVAIIPYTYYNTNISMTKPGSWVNLEFDVIGKYVNRILNS